MKNFSFSSSTCNACGLYRTFVSQFIWIVAFVLCIAISSSVAYGLESKSVISPHSKASLITDSDTYDIHKPPQVALRLQLKPGWHTYWLNPGDAGDPVRIEISASGAATGDSQDIEWPVPQLIKEGSLVSNAYSGDTVLPVQLDLSVNDRRDIRNDPHILKLKAIGSWLVCKDSCIPEYGEFDVVLPKGTYKASAQTALFDKAEDNLPQAAPWSVMVAPPATLLINDPNFPIRSIKAAHFTPFERGAISEAASQFLVIDPHKFELHLTPSTDFPANKPLEGLLTLTSSTDKNSTYTITAKPAPKLPPPTKRSSANNSASDQQHFMDLILFAFVGGLILNLMPCVFPILAMKIMSFAQMAHQDQLQRRQNALAYSGGTVASFVLLGAMIMFLRYCGIMAGWGIQFQSPVFVGLTLWFLFLIALELLGVFSVQLPAFSTSLHLRHDLIDSTITGVLAVLVASPCTAPFMGIAIAGALNTTPFAGIFVFATLGIGMATPFVVLTYYPSLMDYLPKPGPWMYYLRRGLAFPILASCAWLLWVATRESGSPATFYLGLGLTILGLLAWLYGDYQKRLHEGSNTKVAFITLSSISFLSALLLYLFLALLPNTSELANETEFSVDMAGSVSFSKDKLTLLHSQKKPVFVDMTAAWCLTCIANERMVLDTQPVRYAFLHNHVVFMQGDWTHRDETITNFLHKYGHDGVPFYLFVPPEGEPVILPQILTQDEVIKTLNNAQNTPPSPRTTNTLSPSS